VNTAAVKSLIILIVGSLISGSAIAGIKMDEQYKEVTCTAKDNSHFKVVMDPLRIKMQILMDDVPQSLVKIVSNTSDASSRSYFGEYGWQVEFGDKDGDFLVRTSTGFPAQKYPVDCESRELTFADIQAVGQKLQPFTEMKDFTALAEGTCDPKTMTPINFGEAGGIFCINIRFGTDEALNAFNTLYGNPTTINGVPVVATKMAPAHF